jgi:YD repeat-containing protein
VRSKNRNRKIESQAAPKDVIFVYDAASQLTTLKRYSDLAATSLIAQSAYTYDNLGRMTALAHTKSGGASIAGYTWTYDAASRKTLFDFTDSANNDEDATYSYDNTDQLTGADRSGSGNDETYGYDDNGNRTSGGFTVTTDNRYSSVTIDGVVYNLTYDAEGNLTRKGSGLCE